MTNEERLEQIFGRKTFNLNEGWDKKEDKDDLDISKLYDERKNKLEMWQGDAKCIGQRLNGWIFYTKYNQHIETSAERLEKVEGIHYDRVLLDYLHSEAYATKNVKRKKDFLSESDFLYGAKVEWLANYIIYPDYKRYHIKSKKALKRDTGRLPTKDRKNFLRTLTISDVSEGNKDGEVWEGYNAKGFLNKSAGQFFERMMTDIEPVHSTYLYNIDLSNTQHIKVLLERYYEWQQLICEQNMQDSDIVDLFNILDELIQQCKFSDDERKLIEMLKGYKDLRGKKLIEYKDMHHCINNLTYRQIEYRSSVSIPKKIAKTYSKQKKLANHKINKKYPKQEESKWYDAEIAEKNKVRNEKYNSFASNGEVKTEVWSKEEIEKYFSFQNIKTCENNK